MKNKKNLSKKDLNDWKEYLNNPKDLIDKDIQNNSTNTNKRRFTFDLHGYSLIEANKKVDEIVNFCSQKKYSEILLITGKGIIQNLIMFMNPKTIANSGILSQSI